MHKKPHIQSSIVTWLSTKVLPKLDLTQCHLFSIAISDPCYQTACLWVSASLRPLFVCLQSGRKPRRVAYWLVSWAFSTTVTKHLAGSWLQYSVLCLCLWWLPLLNQFTTCYCYCPSLRYSSEASVCSIAYSWQSELAFRMLDWQISSQVHVNTDRILL